jgi:hypothetical protein
VLTCLFVWCLICGWENESRFSMGKEKYFYMFFFYWETRDLFIIFSVFKYVCPYTQSSVNIFSVVKYCMPIHTIFSWVLSQTTKVQLNLLGVMDVLHFRFILTRKSRVSQILGHHLDILEGFFEENEWWEYILIGRWV